MTLIGAAGAGLLLWLASQLEADSTGEFWTQIGLVAAAGLAMALSQLLGGWTKWGWPRISGSVFLLGFLPALVVGGLVVLQAQPDSGAFGAGWAADLGADGLAEDLTGVLPAIAFGLGLLLGFTLDTTGRQVRDVGVAEGERVRRTGYAGPVPVDARAADEPVAAERRETVTAPYRERDRDQDGVDDRDEALVGARQEHHHDTADDGHRGTSARVEEEPRRRRFFGR